jgi:hypothetical protein
MNEITSASAVKDAGNAKARQSAALCENSADPSVIHHGLLWRGLNWKMTFRPTN